MLPPAPTASRIARRGSTRRARAPFTLPQLRGIPTSASQLSMLGAMRKVSRLTYMQGAAPFGPAEATIDVIS